MHHVRIVARHQSGSRRPAASSIVKLSEHEAVLREAIKIRCFDFTAIAAEIREAGVISQNEDDIWFLGKQTWRCNQQEGENR